MGLAGSVEIPRKTVQARLPPRVYTAATSPPQLRAWKTDR